MSEISAKNASKPKKWRLRASRACDRCHGRKVRCDITQTAPGKACTNCRLDKQSCISYTGSRTASFRAGASENPLIAHSQRTLTSPKEADEFAVQQQLQVTATKEPPSTQNSISNQAQASSLMSSLNFQVTDLWKGQLPLQNDLADIDCQPLRKRSGSFKIPRLRFSDIYESRGLDEHLPFSYYEFLKLEKLSTVQPGDVRFLEFNGSLHVPMKPILDEFVREYFLHVHPGLPLLDERQFWITYEHSAIGEEKSHRISLFVLQAMLCVSSSFIPLNVLRCCGFDNIRQARETFYRRAKSLFDFHVEHDFVAAAQGALLLSYYVSNTDPQINTYWLGVAIQNAKTIGAQLYNSDRTLSSNQRMTSKRLWWCCILRDRILPLGVRRPIQITQDHFDFTNNGITEDDMQDQIGWSRVYQPATQKLLIKVFIAQCELAVHLTDTIMTVYPLNGSSPAPPTSADDLRIIEDRISRQRENLLQWFTKFNLWSSPQTESHKNHVSVTLFAKLLHMYYHSARLALCHYEVLVVDAWTFSREDHARRLEASGSRVRTAVDATTELMSTLMRLKVAQYLPISAVAYTALPLALSALDLKLSSNTIQMDDRRRQLEVYVEAMKLYRGKYDGTEQVSDIIERFLSEAESQTRRLCPTPSTTSAEGSVVPLRKTEDWCDIFRQHPKFHLRLMLAIDFSFSRGRFPQDSDFPVGFRATQLDDNLAVESNYGKTSLKEQNTAVMGTGLLKAAWAANGKSTGALTPLSDETYAHLNLDFADLFGEQNTSTGHGWVEEDVQDLFDYSMPS